MYEELRETIKFELDNLDRLVGEMGKVMAKNDKGSNFIVIRAAGSIMHDFYCGIEKILNRIAIIVDGNMPKGNDWHIKLLVQMSKPFGKKRGSIIDDELLMDLKELLRFRHLFRNIYGFELKWERIAPLAVRLEIIADVLRKKLSIVVIKNK